MPRLSTSLQQDWLIQTGTTAADEPVACVADDLDNLYIAGFTSGQMEGTSAGGEDVFVQKLNQQGQVQWTLQTGSVANDRAAKMVMDPFGALEPQMCPATEVISSWGVGPAAPW